MQNYTRDAKGRFTSNNKGGSISTTSKQKANTNLKRDASGRFVSMTNSNVISSGPSSKSSFIKSMKINGDVVEVVIEKYPNTVYGYKPSSKEMQKVKDALKNQTSLGQVYNKILRGREVYRTIYNVRSKNA